MSSEDPFRDDLYLYNKINIFIIFGQGRLVIFHIGALLDLYFPFDINDNLVQQKSL